MKTLKEINAEAKKFAPNNEVTQEAFIQGARYALTGKYLKEAEMFESAVVLSGKDVFSHLRELCVPTFEEWWNAYNKKRGRKKAEAKWNKLSNSDKEACMKATPAYVASTPDVTYRKDPLTYLNGECWNDEIINKTSNEQQRAQRLAERTRNLINSAFQQ